MRRGRPLRGRRHRLARRRPGPSRRRPPGHPACPRLVRGAPRRSGRRRRLHPAAQPPPRRVDDRGGAGRQARPVREAAGDDRGRRRADGRRRCEAEGVVLMEAFMYRLHPSWVAVRELVASGRIGRLTAVQSWFSYFNDDAGQHPEHPRGRRRGALRHRLLQREPVADAVRCRADRRVGRRSPATRSAASTS